MPLTMNESLIYSAVKITKFVGGKAVETGTGFFWNASTEPGQMALSIVTNKHVMANAEAVVIRFHLATDATATEPSGRFSNYQIDVPLKEVVGHPDPSVDLCAFGIAGIIPDLQSKGQTLFYKNLSAENIPKPADWLNFDAIEDVLMIGCPNGIVDEFNNRPIVRRGITATSMDRRYNDKPEFMVDMACFPGSSGSPVFINQLGYLDRATDTYKLDARRFFLVGVLYAGPLINNLGTITFGKAPTVQVASMMHLGNVIQGAELLILNQAISDHIRGVTLRA
ncbi:S1 family peptidase [Sphingomonas sp. PAMC 26617]|uniref:S1 family peptidase n=1 Tax=Sphingomonas sp. PAMC 26617 TaxID=1112216 RepID=UPI000288418C|nr:serine protease [Sphingomonas sp. PAMC 26617]